MYIEKHAFMGGFKGFSRVVLTVHDFGMLAPGKMQLHFRCSFNMCGRRDLFIGMK
jgi:hypothetical protein